MEENRLPQITLPRIHEEEEEKEEFEEIPEDSLWAYYEEGSEEPVAFVYFEGEYKGSKPVLLVYHQGYNNWSHRPPSANLLQSLTMEAFWELKDQKKLWRVDDPLVYIRAPKEE